MRHLRKGLFTIFSLAFLSLQAQHIDVPPPGTLLRQPAVAASARLSPASSREICGNGRDDNGNGLADINDPHCYFDPANLVSGCPVSKILWASSNRGLHFINLETNEQGYFPQINGEIYYDLSWSSNGDLFGLDGFGNLMEINPVSFEASLATDPGDPDQRFNSNALTGDASGNLFMACSTSGGWKIVKFNVTTRASAVVFDMSAYQLESAGDLCFMNGYLYVSCTRDILAKISLANNTADTFTIKDPPSLGGSYGMTTMGDVYLYLSAGGNSGDIYRLDPTTMKTSFVSHIDYPDIIFMGFASYPDLCNAPGCRGKVVISRGAAPPYCAATGVLLTASSAGIGSSTAFTWQLPDLSSLTGSSITARTSGMYHVAYQSVPDSCAIEDSVYLSLVPFPRASLGKDTVVCRGGELVLLPDTTAGIDEFKWNDGTSAYRHSISAPGHYWLTVKNSCGTSSDTVAVADRQPPEVFLGNDTLLCFDHPLTLKNLLPVNSSAASKWSEGSVQSSITVSRPGTYALTESNSCGMSTDEIRIVGKDSCLCEPFFPLVNLGPDRLVCHYDTVRLGNAEDEPEFRYRWQDGSASATLVVKDTGTYWLDVSTYCGTVRDTVTIGPKVDDCECYLYVPNAFSPNRDGNNDIFKLTSNCDVQGSIKIYNRWGGLVFSSSDLRRGWDGFSGRTEYPSGVYLYMIQYNYERRPGSFMKKGYITLVH